MEAINALNRNFNNYEMGMREINLNCEKEELTKNQLQINSEAHKIQENNKIFSRSSSKKLSNMLKIKKQLSTPSSTTMDEDKHQKTETRKTIRVLKRLLKINDTLAAILGIIGVLLAVIEYEDFYDDTHKPRYTSTETCTLLRSFVSITTAIIIVLLIIHSLLSYQLSSQQLKGYETKVSYFSSNQLKQLILEIIIIAIHCPPTWDYSFTVWQLGASVDYSIDGICMTWMLLRFYLVFRLFAQYSKWTNELAEQSCEIEGCEANTLFAMKAVLKEKPFTSLLCMMTISAIIFGLAVRHFERPYYYYGYQITTPGFQDYSYIWNGMWLIMITMMTVGYGDFYPKTHMGRFVCILACFWGVFLVSMMVVTLTVVSSFDQKESRAYDILFRLNIKQNIRKKAAFVVTFIMRIVVLNKRFQNGKISKDQYVKEKIILKSKLDVKLQYYRDSASKISDYVITSEESLRQLTEKIDRDLDEVKEILLSLIEMEKQLNEIEQSQMIVANAMNECINFTNNLEDHLNEYKEKVVKKIILIKKQKENKGGLINDYGKLKKIDDLRVKNDEQQISQLEKNNINKLITFD